VVGGALKAEDTGKGGGPWELHGGSGGGGGGGGGRDRYQKKKKVPHL